jgi:hypothetical protein
VNETGDVTPVDKEMLEPVNAYIPDNAIVNLITAVYKTGDETSWYDGLFNMQETAQSMLVQCTPRIYSTHQTVRRCVESGSVAQIGCQTVWGPNR